jgi:2-aminoadipate transaminase
VRRSLPIYRERRDALLDALATYMPEPVTWTRPEGGFCTWVTLPRHHSLQHIYRQALARGWAFAPGEAFLAEPDVHYHLRICFGSASPDIVRRGVRCLAEIVDEQMARPLPAPANADGTPLV